MEKSLRTCIHVLSSKWDSICYLRFDSMVKCVAFTLVIKYSDIYDAHLKLYGKYIYCNKKAWFSKMFITYIINIQLEIYTCAQCSHGTCL